MGCQVYPDEDVAPTVAAKEKRVSTDSTAMVCKQNAHASHIHGVVSRVNGPPPHGMGGG